jgi:predicted transcriptional regulator
MATKFVGVNSVTLNFPEDVATPAQRVLFTLWQEGEQSLCRLMLRTGLRREEFEEAMRELKEGGQIKTVPSRARGARTERQENLDIPHIAFVR